MTSDEIFDFYDENWNDYNKINVMLHQVINQHEEEIKVLKNKLDNVDNTKEVSKLKALLQECHDTLDEERHSR